MDSRTKVILTDLIGNSNIGTFQTGVFVLCAVCLLMDGFDVQVRGFTTSICPPGFRLWSPAWAAAIPAFISLIAMLSLTWVIRPVRAVAPQSAVAMQ